MKKIILLLSILISSSLYAQEEKQELLANTLTKPSEGKCMVYITRRETAALLVKFSIYDGDLFLGKLKAKKYFAYECDPGEHIFIGKGENTFYVDATLEAGKTYVMDLKIQMGVVSARVKLIPIDRSYKKYEKERKKIIEFVNQKEGELLSEEVDEDEAEITATPAGEMSKRLQNFYNNKEKGKKMTTITPDMYFE